MAVGAMAASMAAQEARVAPAEVTEVRAVRVARREVVAMEVAADECGACAGGVGGVGGADGVSDDGNCRRHRRHRLCCRHRGRRLRLEGDARAPRPMRPADSYFSVLISDTRRAAQQARLAFGSAKLVQPERPPCRPRCCREQLPLLVSYMNVLSCAGRAGATL